jgi:hypothetical protein
MRLKKHIYTDRELMLLQDTKLSTRELSVLLGLRVGTVKSKRIELDVKLSKGAKKGKANTNKIKNEIRVCLNEKCLKEFTVKPAMTKKFCCKSCSTTVNNPAPKGKGSRPYRVNPNRPEYTRYSQAVHNLSHKIYLENIDSLNPNRYPRTLCGVEGGYQLDHIIPIKECFNKGLSVHEAASITNLRLLPWKVNLMRNFN